MSSWRFRLLFFSFSLLDFTMSQTLLYIFRLLSTRTITTFFWHLRCMSYQISDDFACLYDISDASLPSRTPSTLPHFCDIWYIVCLTISQTLRYVLDLLPHYCIFVTLDTSMNLYSSITWYVWKYHIPVRFNWVGIKVRKNRVYKFRPCCETAVHCKLRTNVCDCVQCSVPLVPEAESKAGSICICRRPAAFILHRTGVRLTRLGTWLFDLFLFWLFPHFFTCTTAKKLIAKLLMTH